MSDPRVESLAYKFVVEEGHDFSAARPLDVRLANFDCRLDASGLVARPSVDYATAREAREVLEPRLSAWEASAEIGGGVHIRFSFSGADVVNRDPNSPIVPLTVSFSGGGGIGLGSSASLTIGHGAFPDPPSEFFTESETVTVLRERLAKLGKGREPLLSTANWILTKLEWEHGGRKGVAQALNIASRVLSKLGDLAAQNDPQHGRKVKRAEQPLTGEEVSWVRTVLPLLLTREAERVGGSPGVAQLTMADLPELP